MQPAGFLACATQPASESILMKTELAWMRKRQVTEFFLPGNTLALVQPCDLCHHRWM